MQAEPLIELVKKECWNGHDGFTNHAPSLGIACTESELREQIRSLRDLGYIVGTVFVYSFTGKMERYFWSKE